MINQLSDAKCINIPRLLLIKAKDLGITTEEMTIILYVYELEQMNFSGITPQTLMQFTTFQSKSLDQLLSLLIKKGFIENKLGTIATVDLEKKLLSTKLIQVEQKISLLEIFEKEFKRTLSPMEIETLRVLKTTNQFSDEIIIQALHEAVKSNILNFRYIEGILTNWAKNGVKPRYIQNDNKEPKIASSNVEWWKL